MWQSKVIDKLHTTPPPVLLSDNVLAELDSELEKLDAAVVAARKLIDYPEGRFGTKYSPEWMSTLVAEQQEAREVAALLQLDIFRALYAGDGKTAVRSCRALLNVGRSLGDEPLLISQLIRMSLQGMTVKCVERVLAHGTANPADLRLLEDAFAEEAAFDMFVTAVRGERAGTDQLCRYLVASPRPLHLAIDDVMRSRPAKEEAGLWDWVTDFFGRKMLYHSHSWLLRHHTRLIGAAALPGHERYEALRDIDQETRDFFSIVDNNLILARLLAPAIVKIAYEEQRFGRAVTLRLGRPGRRALPLGAQALAPVAGRVGRAQLSAQRAGRPVWWCTRALRVAPDGVVVHSIGNHGNYDGSGLDRLEELDPNLPRLEFRLWDVSHRRQPPLPTRKQADEG